MIAKRKKPTNKRIPRKTTVPEQPSPKRNDLDFTPHGFVRGSDQALIVETLVEGGKDRKDVLNKARKRLPSATTRSTVIAGKEVGQREKNVSSLISALLPQLEARGYKIESHWKLVPPRDVRVKLADEGTKQKRSIKTSLTHRP